MSCDTSQILFVFKAIVARNRSKARSTVPLVWLLAETERRRRSCWRRPSSCPGGAPSPEARVSAKSVLIFRARGLYSSRSKRRTHYIKLVSKQKIRMKQRTISFHAQRPKAVFMKHGGRRIEWPVTRSFQHGADSHVAAGNNGLPRGASSMALTLRRQG